MSIALLVLVLIAAPLGAASPPRPADLQETDPMIVALIDESVAALEADPESATAWARLAMIYDAHGIALASECYREALERDASVARWWHHLSVRQAGEGDLDAALETNRRALELEPSYLPAHWRRGLFLLDRGENAAAEAAFRRGLDLDATNLDAANGLARALIAQRRFEDAVAVLVELLRRAPTNAFARYQLGTAYRFLGRTEDARVQLSASAGAQPELADPWYEEVRALRTGITNLVRDSNSLLQRGRTEEVIARLTPLVEENPDDAVLINKLSEAYIVARQPSHARRVLERALAADPDYYATHLHLAQAWAIEGNEREVQASVGRAIELNPRLWQSHYELGQSLYRQKRYAEAAQALESALSFGAHQQPNAILLLGESRYRSAEWEQAVAAFEQAAARYPYLVEAFTGLGASLVELGRFPEAREAITRAGRLNPRHPSLRPIIARLKQLESEAAAAETQGDR